MFVSLLTLLACSSTPSSIDVNQPVLITDVAQIDLGAKVLDAKGEAMEEAVVTATAVSDPEVMRLGNGGQLQCARSGEVTVTLSSGELTQDVAVKCLVVQEIRLLNPRIEVVLDRGTDGSIQPAEHKMPGFEVVDVSGELLPVDVANVTMPSEHVARIAGDVLQVLTPGKTTIDITAGDKTASVPVKVGLEVVREAGLVVKDGKTHGVPLKPGGYHVVVASDQPVTLTVKGTDCSTEEGLQGEMDCTLEKTGSLVVENPGLLGLGDDAKVMLRVVQYSAQ